MKPLPLCSEGTLCAIEVANTLTPMVRGLWFFDEFHGRMRQARDLLHRVVQNYAEVEVHAKDLAMYESLWDALAFLNEALCLRADGQPSAVRAYNRLAVLCGRIVLPTDSEAPAGARRSPRPAGKGVPHGTANPTS